MCKTEDFLTTEDKNFHPTDVFEDADGSLIVIDTGGWFRIGCPTSQIARPEFKGAIYRVRKDDMPLMTPQRVAQLRGFSVNWSKAALMPLAQMLPARPELREQAIQELARRGKASLPVLDRITEANPFPSTIQNAIWCATRIEEPEARTFVRRWLKDKDLGVQLTAIHSAGLHRDAKALATLSWIVSHESHPAVTRQAATALGRLKNADAIGPIMDALGFDGDRFREHALIYALIQIDDRKKTAPFLNDRNPRVRRAALIALDQMPNGNLTREELAVHLNPEDPANMKAALDIVASRPKWATEITGILRDMLMPRDPGRAQPETARGLLMALSKESAIQDLTVAALRHADTTPGTRLMLMETVGRAPVAKLPATWLDELGKSLEQPDDALAQAGIAAIRARSLTQFDYQLGVLAHNPRRSAETRVQAFGAIAPRAKGVAGPMLNYLLAQLEPKRPPLLRLAAAKGLSQVKLNDAQLTDLAKHVGAAGPLEMPVLLAAFEKNTSAKVGHALLDALGKAPSLPSVSPAALDRATRDFPDEVRTKADAITKALQPDAGKQKARLDELEPLAKGGSVEQGRDIYFGTKASCSACHAINSKGGGVGPDLGKIGAIRSGRDLLESIVFPSASFARGFEPYVVETKAGKTHSGILARESTDAVYLLTTERVEIRIGREEIEAFAPGRVSIMPQGLETQLSRRELQDLLAYLQSLR